MGKFLTFMTESANDKVIDLFINDSFPKDKKKNWGSGNLKIQKEPAGWSLINYLTAIAYRPDKSKKVFFNTVKYSPTTSKIQRAIESAAETAGVKLVKVDEDKINSEIGKEESVNVVDEGTSKYYTGKNKKTGEKEVFTSVETPTEESHGKIYTQVIGPFRTKHAASLMAKYGEGNPHMQTVYDVERLAKKGMKL